MVMVVIVVVMFVIMVVIFLGKNNIVVRVAVIGDQNAAVVVASELDSVDVNLVDGGEDRLAIVLDHDFCWADSSGSELRVNVVTDLDVATNLVQLDSVGAERLLLGLVVVMRVIFRAIRDCWAMRVVVSVTMAVVLVTVGIPVMLVEVRIGRSMLVVVWVIMRVVMLVEVMRMIMRVIVRVVVIVIVVMVMFMIMVIMARLHAIKNNIIMRVTIVRNEYTSVIIASELDCIRVDLGHGGNDSLTICLKDSSGLGDSSCSKLRVSTWVSCRISSNDVQINAM